MSIILCLICIILVLKPREYDAKFTGVSHGTLSDRWTFNFTLFMKRFGGRLLNAIDYDRNQLELSVHRNQFQTMNVSIRFNRESDMIHLFLLCGCDPCDEILMDFYLHASEGKVILTCNNHGTVQLPKHRIKNRAEVNLPGNVRDMTELKDAIHIGMFATSQGCLYSFHHNGQLLQSFTSGMSRFMSSCPRQCPKGTCNKGKCRYLDRSGSDCDCNSTALNGPNCSNNLTVYRQEYNNSYEISKGSDNIYLKLTWKPSLMKAHCLLQFVNRKKYETFSIHKSKLVKDHIDLTDIDEKDINFLTVILKKNDREIKVNNKIILKDLVFVEGTVIHIGFSEIIGECDTFKGSYDIRMSEFGIRPVAILNFENHRRQIDWKIIFGCIGLALIGSTTLGIVVAIIFRRENKGQFDKIGNNREMVNYTVVDKKVEQPDDYDHINPENVYSTTLKCTRTKGGTTDLGPPKLPPRNF